MKLIDQFEGGKDLIKIIENKGWQLYDESLAIEKSRGKPYTWSYFEKQGPAEILERDTRYLIVPRPKENKSLYEAYRSVNGFGPCMCLESKLEHAHMDGESPFESKGKMYYIFSRVEFTIYKDINIAELSMQVNLPISHSLKIPEKYVVEKFKKHFTIMSIDKFRKLIGLA